jgi:hypothetical protein
MVAVMIRSRCDIFFWSGVGVSMLAILTGVIVVYLVFISLIVIATVGMYASPTFHHWFTESINHENS